MEIEEKRAKCIQFTDEQNSSNVYALKVNGTAVTFEVSVIIKQLFLQAYFIMLRSRETP